MENVLHQNSNKRKKTPPSQSQLMVDTISDFPDEILTHILSFLPIEEAFKTSVLSKRWVLLCHSISDLHFDDKRVDNSKDLIHFRRILDTVLFSPRSQHQTLKSLHLHCHSELWESEETDCFDKWLEAAKQRRVQYLNLYLFRIPLAPTAIFCCKTLVVLNLASICVGTLFNCSVDLPLLKSLFLMFVSFKDMEDFMKLLSGCPKLEFLDTFLREPDVTTVEENAGVTARGYFKPLSKLIEAEIYSFEVPFSVVYNVQFLTINEMGKNLRNKKINSYYKGFPVFGNLTYLRLCWSEGIHDWDEVVKMLQNCPKLQALSISKGYDSTTIENWKYPDHVPGCVTSHLTTCEIEDYEALEADFRFASYILQNAKLLQVMTICHTLYPKPMESPKFLEDLSSFPTISPTCKLKLR